MRRISVLSIVGVVALALAVSTATATDSAATRTIRGDLTAGSGEKVGVENLAGSMRIVAGGGSRIEVVATVHAESDRLAGTLKLVEATGQHGERILRVEYPLDEITSYRYPGGGSSEGGWLGLFGGNSNTSTKYAGRSVRVSSSRGTELWADIEIRVPSGAIDAYFRNVVGDITASDIDGDFLFDSGSGNVGLDRIRGKIRADTGSGNIEARELSGSFSGDTGSGDITLTGFIGESISCDTGSGDVEIREAEAESISGDTGSGSISIKEIKAETLTADTGSGGISVRGGMLRYVNADTGSGSISIIADGIEKFRADTGSGDVTLETDGRALRSVDVDTGSGDAELRMGSGVTFHAMAEQGSGKIRNGYEDARAIIHDREVVGYRRGDEQVRITFETGSGSLILEPLR
jgi:DUF4097 and DUF4098 domain-containing protein YvlB